ncbi:structure-specific endonuclease subunit SLX1 homolog [Scaptodrosophila lebanonensis]|uniref:Structure-specific endonuclease subunit SLX1 homolog n=1 Tax=Drosophila lebanonensis TaxID=7225 RepID=A0A6J2TKU5_DROLE|nr:structure-specific endonuclease subunit SLX1 homolog [Scaptodrosophila lebanonensis]
MNTYEASSSLSPPKDAVAHKGQFYGVYLLCSQSPDLRYRGKCYVGFTVNPNRRIKQHNRGRDFGGAKKTSNKGPWEMVMIVHGFPNNIAALQFEWAWQQPTLSTRLKTFNELKRKRPRESHFDYNFRIVSCMLCIGPWHRLPLTIRWLEVGYERDFLEPLPKQMQVVSGKVAITASQRKLKSLEQPATQLWTPECHLCMQRIVQPERSRIGCLNATCCLTCHIICLANYMLGDEKGHYIPVTGVCPLCETTFTWAALLQRKRTLQKGGGCEEEAYGDELSDMEEPPDVNSDIEEVPQQNEKIYELSD